MFGKPTLKTTPAAGRRVAGKKAIQSIAVGLCLGIAAVGLTATPAHAFLIEQDLNAVGDNLITLDTVTGLEWLDVTATLGLSYNAAEASLFVTAQGFRHANRDEVSALYTNAGVTDQSDVWVVADITGAQDLVNKMGCTQYCGAGDQYAQHGWVDLVPEGTDTMIAHVDYLTSGFLWAAPF
ncbi:MAG: hypothetical protein ACTSXZ_05365, partial [Alphaproteobacteria bacterium]